jgi:hypothetical protein
MSAATDLARVVETPAGHFRLSYSNGNGPSSREHVETARRYGTLPDDLAAITDVVADPCWPDGARYRDNPDAPNGRDERPTVTVNRVEYTGTLYYLSRGYFIGADYAGDNGWSVSYPADENGDSRPYGHYWTGQHLTRETSRSYFDPISEAGLRKLAGFLADPVTAMLEDQEGLRAYWRGRFESSAGYALSDARRAVETCNAFLALARGYGSSVPDVALADAPELAR